MADRGQEDVTRVNLANSPTVDRGQEDVTRVNLANSPHCGQRTGRRHSCQPVADRGQEDVTRVNLANSPTVDRGQEDVEVLSGSPQPLQWAALWLCLNKARTLAECVVLSGPPHCSRT